jgi:uncharacterized membrane protein
VESGSSEFHAEEGLMSLLKTGSIVIAAYLAAGRTGSVATCLYLGITPLETLLIALIMDVVQIPAYGFMLQTSHRYVRFPKRFRTWLEEKSRRIKERIEKRSYWKRVVRYQPLAVVAVSIIPFRGFGVFSASILAFMMGYPRFAGTFLVMSGSFIGSVLSILVFFFPVRWLSAL